jgi:hypothetical protein
VADRLIRLGFISIDTMTQTDSTSINHSALPAIKRETTTSNMTSPDDYYIGSAEFCSIYALSRFLCLLASQVLAKLSDSNSTKLSKPQLNPYDQVADAQHSVFALHVPT